MTAVLKLVPTTQQYEWGKIGLTSKVAQYAAASKLPGFTLNEKGPYAEVSVLLERSLPLYECTFLPMHRVLRAQMPSV